MSSRLSTKTFTGGCHCGAVRFEVNIKENPLAQECNCSICFKVGFVHLIVPKSAFRLLTGQANLSTYTFNTGVAQHYFCQTCGIKPFYIPRSNPDGYDVNVRCLDTQPADLQVEPFDGQNWEAHAEGLTSLSLEQQ